MSQPLGFVLCVLIWGSTWYGVSMQLGVVPPEWSVAYRFATATVLLFGLAKIRGLSLGLSRRQHGFVALVGTFLFSTNYLMIYSATQYLTSGLVAVGFSLLTIMNILNARIFLGARIQPAVLIASLMGVLGLVLVFAEEVATLSLGDATVIGIGYVIGGTALASFGNTLAATPTMASMPLLVSSAWGMLYGTVVNSAIAYGLNGDPVFDPSARYIGSLIYLSAIGTVAAFTLYLWLIATWGVARSAYMAVLTPIVALIVSTVLEDFDWTAGSTLGLGLVLGGNVLMIQSRKSPGAQPSEAHEAETKAEAGAVPADGRP